MIVAWAASAECWGITHLTSSGDPPSRHPGRPEYCPAAFAHPCAGMQSAQQMSEPQKHIVSPADTNYSLPGAFGCLVRG